MHFYCNNLAVTARLSAKKNGLYKPNNTQVKSLCELNLNCSSALSGQQDVQVLFFIEVGTSNAEIPIAH